MKNVCLYFVVCLTLVCGVAKAQTKNQQATSTNNTQENGIASASLVRTISEIKNGEFAVNIIITKSNFTGFAKLVELLPNGYSITIAQPSSASFNYDPTEKKAKFVWVNIPEDLEIKLSYTVHMDNPSDIQTIRGAFSYVEKDQTKKFILEPNGPVKNDNIAAVTKEAATNTSKPVALAVAPVKTDKVEETQPKTEPAFSAPHAPTKKPASVRFQENSSDFSYLENGETKKFKATPAEKPKTDVGIDSTNSVASAKPTNGKAPDKVKNSNTAKADVAVTQKTVVPVVKTETPASSVATKKPVVKDSSTTIAAKQPVKTTTPEKPLVANPAKADVVVEKAPASSSKVEEKVSTVNTVAEPAAKEENVDLPPTQDKNHGKGYYVVVGVYFSERIALAAQKNPVYSKYAVVKSQSGQRYYIAAPVENRDGLKQAMNDIRHDTDKTAWWVKIE